MPSIPKSEHVLDRIRALKLTSGETEDDVLGRNFDQAFVARESRFRAYEATDQDSQSTN